MTGISSKSGNSKKWRKKVTKMVENDSMNDNNGTGDSVDSENSNELMGEMTKRVDTEYMNANGRTLDSEEQARQERLRLEEELSNSRLSSLTLSSNKCGQTS